jgi:hypothetical protein
MVSRSFLMTNETTVRQAATLLEARGITRCADLAPLLLTWTVRYPLEKLLPMSKHEHCGPIVPPRIVEDWEYKTAYIPTFQLRISSELNDRLSEWAAEEGQPLSDLIIGILEKALRIRAMS